MEFARRESTVPEPCYPKGAIPRVDFRAWANATGVERGLSPRQRGGYWRYLHAAILEEKRRLREAA